mgnify:CR=1 FL=1
MPYGKMRRRTGRSLLAMLALGLTLLTGCNTTISRQKAPATLEEAPRITPAEVKPVSTPARSSSWWTRGLSKHTNRAISPAPCPFRCRKSASGAGNCRKTGRWRCIEPDPPNRRAPGRHWNCTTWDTPT